MFKILQHQRNVSVSVARGVAIIAMVIGHAACSTCVETWVNQFDMAVFFVVSGYCFKDSYLMDPVLFVGKKLKNLYVPFVLIVSLFVVLHNLFCDFGILCVDSVYRGIVTNYYSIRDIGMRLWETLCFRNNEMLLGGFYFIRDLFLVNLSCYGFLIILVRTFRFPARMVVLALLLVFSCVAILSGMQPFLFRFARIWLGMAFFFSGVWMRRYEILTRLMGLRERAFFAFLTLLISIFIVVGLVSRTMRYSNPIPHPLWIGVFIMESLIGAIACMAFCAKFSFCGRRVLAYAGDHSLVILALHFLVFRIITLVVVGLGFFDKAQRASFPAILGLRIGVLYVLCGVCIPLGVRSCLDKVADGGGRYGN